MPTVPASDTDYSTQTGASTLPAYVNVRPDGVYVAVSPPPAQNILQPFVDRLFTNNAYFKGLDYALFLELLYGEKPVLAKKETANEVRLASEIATFEPPRHSLYHGVKIIRNGERAEYVFEPVYTEVTFEEPVYGIPGEDGIIPIVEFNTRTEVRPIKLDFDEFVAEMWCKGVRFGIHADAVRAAIKSDTTTRMDIAVQREAGKSMDAQIHEEKSNLRQDRSPLILSSGRAVLSAAKNYFPQVNKNELLLRKIPRALGAPGYRVTGATIEPRLPKDIDLQKLSGLGTRIDHGAQGDLLVADMDGFLSFDDATKKVSVTATIENKSGISAKSTGDIKLDVDEFVEHGEVQEGRVVQGKHLTFRSAVYGTVLSTSGNIRIDNNLSGGRAKSIDGDITVLGRTYNAALEAWDGQVTIKFAENSTILGKSVQIERAVNCEIVAETVQLDSAEGCAIAGMNILIKATQARRNRESVITVLLPDNSGLESQIAAANDEIIKIDAALRSNATAMSAARTDPKQAKLINLSDNIRNGLNQLTPQQQTEWQKLFAQLPTAVKDSLQLMEKRRALVNEVVDMSMQIKASYANQRCNLQEVQGDTVVQTCNSHLGVSAFRNLPRQAYKNQLQQIGAPRKLIFSGWQGSLEWQHQAPETDES